MREWRYSEALSRHHLEKARQAEVPDVLITRLEQRRREVYVDDLVRDDLFWPGLWDAPASAAEEALREEAKTRRFDHERLSRRARYDDQLLSLRR